MLAYLHNTSKYTCCSLVQQTDASSVRRYPSSTMLKHLRNRVANQSQILCGDSLSRGGGTKICSRHLSHMTKMAATPICGKNSSKAFSGTKGPISTKLGMKHRGLLPIIVCSNDDPRLTLTYFTARSNLVTQAFYRKR